MSLRKTWAFVKLTRPLFLGGAVLLYLLGAALAWAQGSPIDWARLLLGQLLVTAIQLTTHYANEYYDFDVDAAIGSARTPFSGGSGMLQSDLTTPAAVRWAAWGTLLVAATVGVYLSVSVGWPLWVIMAIGGLTSIFYTSHLAHWMVGEVAAGISLGSLVVVGTHWVLAGPPTAAVVWVAIPPGILTALLLFLNEFPDAAADQIGGRRHLVIMLGPRLAAGVYTLALAASYLVTVAGVVLGILPVWVLLSLLTLPLAVKAATGALRHGTTPDRLVGAQAANVGVVLGTELLLALGLMIGA